MRKLSLLLVIALLPMFLLAQKSIIKGTIYDTVSKKGLAYATVSLVSAKDSGLINFTRADSMGNFRLKQVSKGNYLLSASYVGFAPVWVSVTVPEGKEVDMQNVILTDLKSYNSITVMAKRPPVVMNNDTIEFNTENFKTAPNAVVEDMLKKMPGVTIDPDGTVKVNGETIRRVLVNGREFFTGDPKMATKNLNADAVDKVQVYDRKSDRSMFTGVDDGNTQKTINLQLKKDRNHAIFGKVTGGAGTDGKYEAQTNMNKFNGDQQMSFIGMANNTNKQGFSLSDVLNFTGELSKGMRNGGGITITTASNDGGLPITGLGQNQQGVASTWSGGLNINDTWNKKTDLNMSGIASNIHLLTNTDINRQYLFPGNNYNYTASNASVRDITQQRLNGALDQKIDSFTSFKITPVAAFQQQASAVNSNFSSIDLNNNKLNDGFNNSTSKSDGYTFTNDMLFRHRFGKKGRTISADINMNYNNSNQTGTQNSKTTFYSGGLPVSDSILNQINSTTAGTYNTGGNVVYTEPLDKRSLIEFAAFGSVTIGQSDKKAYDMNPATGKHDLLNTQLSNNFKSNYTYTGGSINVRSNQKMYNYTVGASLQAASLESINQTFQSTIRQSFTDVLPNGVFQYKFNNYRNLRLNYSTSTQQPSAQQLQPIYNVSDILNVRKGNPDLKRSYNHNFTLSYNAIDPATRKNFFAFATLGLTQNAIVNADSIFANGSRLSIPVNANGMMTSIASISYGFPIRAIRSNISTALNASYSHLIGFTNGTQNNIDNLGLSPSVNWNFSIDNKIDLFASVALKYSQSRYSLQPALNTNYLTQGYNVEMTNYLPGGFVINNTLNYTINTGRAEGYNTQIPFWNASIAKSVLKNKRLEVKLTALDLLNRNVGTTRNVTQSYIEDDRYNVLQRYFLLSFTFSLNKAAKSAPGTFMIRTIGSN